MSNNLSVEVQIDLILIKLNLGDMSMLNLSDKAWDKFTKTQMNGNALKEAKAAILALLSAERIAGGIEELEKLVALWPNNEVIPDRLASLRREG